MTRGTFSIIIQKEWLASWGFPSLVKTYLASKPVIATATYISGELACFLFYFVLLLALHSFYGWLLTNTVTKDWKESKCPSVGDPRINRGAATGHSWERV